MDEKSRLDFEIEESSPTEQTAQTSSPATASPPVDREGERRVRKALEEASARNAELLHDLEETEVAVSQLHAQQARLESLKEEILTQNSVVQTTEEETKTQFKSHKRYRDSVGKKWYYTLTKMRNKFDAKAKEEQDAYLGAVQRQAAAEKRQKELEVDLKAIEKEGREIEPIARKHGETHALIDSLYESLFAGPTPGFPDEDEREATREDRQLGHDSVTERLKDIKRSRQQLSLFKTALARARLENTRAADDIEYSLFSADGTFIWWQRCERYVNQALGYAGEVYANLPKPVPSELAQTMETLKKTMQRVRNILSEALSSETYLPSRSTLSQYVQRITEGIRSAIDSEVELEKLLVSAEKGARTNIRQTARKLEDSRQALQEIRQGAFEVVVGFGAAAPAYNECCDRAEWYEGEAEQQCQRLPVPTIDEINDLPEPPSYDKVTNGEGADPERPASTGPAENGQEPATSPPKDVPASGVAVPSGGPNVAEVEA